MPFLAAAAWTLSVSLASPIGAGSAQPEILVSFDGARLEFRMEASLHAEKRAVLAVLSDYDRLDRVFPLVVESRELASPERPDAAGTRRVRTLLRGCVLFICRDLEHTLDIRDMAGGWSQGITVPDLSAFRRGLVLWRVDDDPGAPERSRLRMLGYLDPDFRVPRVLGTAIVRGWVRSELETGVGRIETAARGIDAPGGPL